MKKFAITLISASLLIALVGCSSSQPLETSYTDYASNSGLPSVSEKSQPTPDQYDISSYLYWPDDSRFTVVAVERIEDGTNSGITITTLADRKTKVMYLLTEKFQAGYGISMDVLVNAEGKPMIYDGVVK